MGPFFVYYLRWRYLGTKRIWFWTYPRGVWRHWFQFHFLPFERQNWIGTFSVPAVNWATALGSDRQSADRVCDTTTTAGSKHIPNQMLPQAVQHQLQHHSSCSVSLFSLECGTMIFLSVLVPWGSNYYHAAGMQELRVRERITKVKAGPCVISSSVGR